MADDRRFDGHRANGLRCVGPPYTLECRTPAGRDELPWLPDDAIGSSGVPMSSAATR